MILWGLPAHPHRGIETFGIIAVEHQDQMGNKKPSVQRCAVDEYRLWCHSQ